MKSQRKREFTPNWRVGQSPGGGEVVLRSTGEQSLSQGNLSLTSMTASESSKRRSCFLLTPAQGHMLISSVTSSKDILSVGSLTSFKGNLARFMWLSKDKKQHPLLVVPNCHSQLDGTRALSTDR